MSRAGKVLLIVLAVAITLPPAPAAAQRGRVIEDLFRSLGEAQLEREQRKRIEAEIAARDVPPDEQPQLVPLPRDVGSGGARGGFDGTSITVQSREAAEFARTLIDFSTAANSLTVEMRAAAARDPAMRQLLPQGYRLLSQSRTLIAACDGLASLDPIVEPYTSLDASWRELSFALDASGQSGGAIQELRREADRLIAAMDAQLGVTPQFDRRGLRDAMVTAAAHVQSLLDDLELAHIRRDQIATLAHDGRLMRQRLVDLRDRAEAAEYETLTSLLNDFSGVWWEYTGRLEAVGDPHVQRCLDRLDQDLTHAYALLRMTSQNPRGQRPAGHSQGIAGAAVEPDRLIQSVAALELYAQDLQSELRTHAASLQPPEYRASILQASGDLAAHTSHLHTDLSGGARLRALQEEADFVLESWQRLTTDLNQIHARGLLRDHGLGLQRNHRQLLPAVAELAAALVE